MPLSRVLPFLLALTQLLCASGCLVTRVKWLEPDYVQPSYPASIIAGCFTAAPTPDPVQCLYAQAVEHERQGHAGCVDLYYQVALATSSFDCQSPQPCAQAQLHKSALLKLVVTGQRFRRLDKYRGLQIHDAAGARWIPISYHGFVWQTDDFQMLTPVGEYKTNAFRNVHRQAGLGVPLVVTRCGPNDGTFLPDRSVFAATLRISCGGDSAGPSCECISHSRLELYDPLRVDQVVTPAGPQAIAKDLSAPLAYRLRDQRRTILNDFIDPDAARGENRLYLAEPYQPGKIPVVLVHGLLSDPFTWAEMVNELRAQPGFVDHYQLWLFEYPTGRAFLASAAGLRAQLAQARCRFDPHGQDPQLSNMVLVGHSMGGLVAKLQVASSGDHLWRSVANRPLSEVVTSDEYRHELAQAFYFQPSPCVSRVVFIATPHHGSAYANRLIGKLGSSLVSASSDREREYEQLIGCNPGVFSDEVSRRIPTSIDLLDPNSQFLQAIAGLPIDCRVRTHSIIGNRCWSLLQGPSDGVVPVASARHRGVLSERYVDATHSKTKSHPDSIAELLRILDQHRQQPTPTSPAIGRKLGVENIARGLPSEPRATTASASGRDR